MERVKSAFITHKSREWIQNTSSSNIKPKISKWYMAKHVAMDKEGTITNKTSKIRKNKNEYNIILKLILLIYRAKFFQHSKIRLTIIKYTGKRTIPSKNYLLLFNRNNDSNYKKLTYYFS